MLKLHLSFVTILACMSPVFAGENLDFDTYSFDRMDAATRKQLQEFQRQLATFSKGCSKERDQATASLLDVLMKDSACGVAAGQAYITAKTTKRVDATALATLMATIVCGYEVPKAYSAKKEAASHFKNCEDMRKLADEYKKHCAGRPRWMFAYKDALYCYAASADNDLCLLIIDFKEKTASFNKAAKSMPLP